MGNSYGCFSVSREWAVLLIFFSSYSNNVRSFCSGVQLAFYVTYAESRITYLKTSIRCPRFFVSKVNVVEFLVRAFRIKLIGCVFIESI